MHKCVFYRKQSMNSTGNCNSRSCPPLWGGCPEGAGEARHDPTSIEAHKRIRSAANLFRPRFARPPSPKGKAQSVEEPRFKENRRGGPPCPPAEKRSFSDFPKENNPGFASRRWILLSKIRGRARWPAPTTTLSTRCTFPKGEGFFRSRTSRRRKTAARCPGSQTHGTRCASIFSSCRTAPRPRYS